ncbi:uncharacterized protein LOC131689211 isoform X2 [Topomyia yanbarensis]|uniref:uncharacterized protein LOC131689211 isoform X2 n=1 Tax=Topomyia yanbarensis TaxID=2498891 RepID=UPI00273B1E33|nr:uncharacterized protein LOC131689211 isoform X2 [Topomyia yanbarensis]
MDSLRGSKCNVSDNQILKTEEMDSEMEPEKGDLSPENSKKSDNSPLDDQTTKPISLEHECMDKKTQHSNCYSSSGISDSINVNKSVSMQEMKSNVRSLSEDLEVRNSFAFTIDFGDGIKSVDSQRHEKMLERFQNRHRRGVSLSKLEAGSAASATKTGSAQVNPPRRNKGTPAENVCTEVRIRKNSKYIRDSASKRHSWSPRTSMAEGVVKESETQTKNKFTPKSTTLQIAFEQKNMAKDSCSSSEFNAESLESSIGLPCIEPPLENFRNEDDDGSVSEAGTYTLDGDNYTEEQKELMNIDRITSVRPETNSNLLFTTGPNLINSPKRPTSFQDELEVIDLDRQGSGTPPTECRKSNILEVAFFHETSSVQPIKTKQSYLDRFKTRVKNITHKSKTPDKHVSIHEENSPDQGTFTSVTTSGILSTKSSLEKHPRVYQRNSLTKSHIDNSEYVQGVATFNIHNYNEEDKILNCYTDSEKANVLYNYDSPRRKTGADASAISSVVSKKDWIQEWAKNAREYSENPTSSCSNNTNANTHMTKSVDFENRNQFGYDFDIDMTKSDYYGAKKYDEFGDNLDRHHLHRKQLERLINNNSSSDPSLKQVHGNDGSGSSSNELTRRGSIRQYSSPNTAKPPMSPSKIPSPIGSVDRARSVSRNRSLQGSTSDLSLNETEMYLQKTAAAISTLQNLQRRNSLRSSSLHNSSQSSPLNPASRRMSPKISPMNSLHSPVHNFYQDKVNHIDGQAYSPQHQQLRSLQQQQQQQNILNHKRNLSLDGSETYVNALSSQGYGNQMNNNMNAILDLKKSHTRHNSFEGITTLPPKPVKCFQNYDHASCYTTKGTLINSSDVKYNGDEESLIALNTGLESISLSARKGNTSVKQPMLPAVGRTSLQVKAAANVLSRPTHSKSTPTQALSPIKRSSSFSVKAIKPVTPTLTPKLGSRAIVGGNKIQKSASSTSFKKMVANYNEDDDEFYINDDDDLEFGPEYSSNSEVSDKEDFTEEQDKEPLTNTRYNKTFLMRMEQNKKIATGLKQGVAACPNTPELPRRTLQVRCNVRDRSSMPRDSSLNRMKQELNVSRKSSSKELALKEFSPVPIGSGTKQKVQPKYLDISKYKITGAGNFLKKDESKSYLMKPDVKKSPSSASVGISRTEPSRMSARSIKSAAAKLSGAQKNAKEQELEMWRRRASYDPMKAAMEGKRKQEEARRQTQQQVDRLSKCNESSVLRSKSYHSGVGHGTGPLYHGNDSGRSNLKGAYDQENNNEGNQLRERWTFTSTESSDDFEDE